MNTNEKTNPTKERLKKKLKNRKVNVEKIN